MPRPEEHPYGSRILERGMVGRDVWELQIKLIAWGSGSENDGIGAFLAPVAVTGRLDTITADAVRRFQKHLGLPVSGVVDHATFRAIDDEAAAYPITVGDLRCPCVTGKNDGPIPCRCGKHPEAGKCDGFGLGRFVGEHLLDGAEAEHLRGEKLDLYDAEEHPGMDKAVLWAARGLARRAGLEGVRVVAGYRCWEDSYHTTDDTRWEHRRGTFHLGKTIELRCTSKCVTSGSQVCARCVSIREVAVKRCGFQLRWHQKDRVAVAEVSADARPPAQAFAVLVSTVRRTDRPKDEFVKTERDAAGPFYEGGLGHSLPVDVSGVRRDPRIDSSEPVFEAIEKGPTGRFPVGRSRIWHGGVHLHGAPGTAIRAIADGAVIACRVGEDEATKPYGSRNFVLVEHTWREKKLYSLYMHLDGAKADEVSEVPWRRALAARAAEHLEVLVPGPIYEHDAGARRLVTAAGRGAGRGERFAVTEKDIDVRATLDPTAPTGSRAAKLAPETAGGGARYVYTKRGGEELASVAAAAEGLADKLASAAIVGFASDGAVRVSAGEVIGKIAAREATDPSLAPHGPFVHVEVFSAENLLDEEGYALVDVASRGDAVDRSKVLAALLEGKLSKEPRDKVLHPDDWAALAEAPANDPGRLAARSVVLKMPSAWAMDWRAALKEAATWSFMDDKDRDALGDAFNEQRFWSEAKDAGAALPASETVFHYHPVTLIVQMANTQEAAGP